MGPQCGVTTSIIPSDELTRLFLSSQHREQDYTELKADKDAAYARIVDIDLSQLEPLAAKPHSPDNIGTVRHHERHSCQPGIACEAATNSSYKDLVTRCQNSQGT
jgi:aconitate hydratase